MSNELDRIKQLAELLLMQEVNAFEAQELASKFAQLAEQYRHDQVIRHVGGVLDQVAKKDPHRIVRDTDIFDLYNRFAGLDPNSRFKEVCADLLPPAAIKQAKQVESRIPFKEGERDLSVAREEAKQLEEHAAALEQDVEALKDSIGHMDAMLLKVNTHHDPAVVEAAKKLVTEQLQKIGHTSAKTSFKYGVKHCLLYLASFPTAQGTVHINVPVFVKNSNLEHPSVFADATGKTTYALTPEGLDEFLMSISESRESSQLDTANSMRHNMTVEERNPNDVNAVEVDEYDLLEAKKNTPQIDVEGILMQTAIESKSKHDLNTIRTGQAVVTNELGKLGHTNVKVMFAGDHESGLAYHAAIKTANGVVDITLPVEVVKNKLLCPTKFAADDGKIHNLTGAEMDKVLAHDEFVEPVKYTSALIDMDYNSLRKAIHTAVFDRKHDIAQEALSVIQKKFGSDAHNAAISDYQTWIEESSQDYSKRCASCKFYRPRNGRYATSSQDYCNLLHMPCKQIVKKAGICTRSHIEWDRLRDDSYKGTITTNNIKLT